MSFGASTMSNNMRLPYIGDGTAVYTSVNQSTSSPSPSPTPTYNNPNGASGGGRNSAENNSMALVAAGMDVSGGEVGKRKRGRPRKYPLDASVSPAARIPPAEAATQASGFSSPAFSSGKKPRGRPRGSVNKQQHAPAASGSPGVGFMPHILDVKAGEDVLAKLMWFSKNSTRAVCILSANGAVSNVTLQQAATSGGTVTYEGLFEILSLCGSFMVSETDGQRSRTGGLSVQLCGPDGRILGGKVAGLLVAASAVQMIVGSFVPSSNKQTRTGEAEVMNTLGTPSGSLGGGLGSPLVHTNNSNPQGMVNMPWR